ncbi:MAG TPA: hypothetical protein VHF50_03570 [Solirubrobacterales bacterium]|nr:hypothetical protein [Solirubrobacterales bacterium]
MVSLGSYILSIVLLAALVGSLGFAAVRLRKKLLPDWEGAPAHLVDAVLGAALLIWLSELLGLVALLYAGTLVGAAVLLAGLVAFLPAGPVAVGDPPPLPVAEASSGAVPPATPPAGQRAGFPAGWSVAVAVAVIAAVFADWGLTAVDALGRGIFNFDSLWYHQPFAVEMAKSHSVTELHYTETVFTNWFYPQNSELFHAVGILLTDRDTLSLFINFGWLGMAFLAAWCIGRPWGRADLSVVAVAILLSSHTLVVREPGAAKNDVMAAALLLASIALLVTSWARTRSASPAGGVAGGTAPEDASATGRGGGSPAATGPVGPGASSLGWPLAAAGLAVGLAVGTKVTALAMAAALTVAVVTLAPAGTRRTAALWWFLPALAGGGYWYLRNLVAAGNPLPQVESLGPISLPHPEQLQSGRPDFSIVHYATDTGIWSEYFGPGLEDGFGILWPLAVGGAVLAGVLLLFRGPDRMLRAMGAVGGPDRILRAMGAVVLVGVVAYLFTPLSAAGAEGAPEGFKINLRFAVPALLAGLALLPLAVGRLLPFPSHGRLTEHALLFGGLLAVLVVTDRLDAVLRDPDRVGAWAIALLFVLVPAALLFARRRGAPRPIVAAGFAALALLVAAVGYPVQRDYLGDRFRNADQEAAIPGMSLDPAYRWARNVEDSHIGLVGTTAGFLGYGFYGTDLSNEVTYLGERGPHGAFNAIPDCRTFRAAVNDAGLDYLVTAPFLNFIETDRPLRSPEAGWLRGGAAARPVQRSGQVTVWRVRGRLAPGACGPRNAPLRYVPQQPG